jgi:hypothetical protein
LLCSEMFDGTYWILGIEACRNCRFSLHTLRLTTSVVCFVIYYVTGKYVATAMINRRS